MDRRPERRGDRLMNPRSRVMLIGGLVGGLIGVLAAQLYLRSAEIKAEQAEDVEEAKLPSLEPGDMIKLVLSVLGVLKLVDGLAQPGKS